MITTRNLILGAALIGATLASSNVAQAEGRRTNGLEKDVAVRHRRLLVKNRFEFTPLFESSIDADYMHTIGGGLKLEYHLSDMLSIGVVGVASASIHTALTDKILNSNLPSAPDPAMPRVPTHDEFLDHLNTMPFHGAAYVSITPWYGKLAAFSQAFVAFDFYFQGGLSFAQLNSNCPTSVCSDTHPGTTMGTEPPDLNPNNDPPQNSGFKPGLYLGGGIHVFLSDFLALDLTVRDYAFSDNPSGADYNADLYVGNNKNLGDDNRFIHHLFFGAGLSVLLPTTVKRTP
jgi:outer membrane beta-barrel protein